MDINIKLKKLEDLYKIYDDFVKNFNFSCKKYCSTCCTCNVTMTTLEGHYINKYLDNFKKLDLKIYVHKKRFKPQITINQIGYLCIKGQEIPIEENDPSWGECVLLENGECPIYQVRPFSCRSFLSISNCKDNGSAYVDPFILTVSEVLFQFIEHIDSDGYTGNLIDILIKLQGNEIKLIPNRHIHALMIPPENREKIKPLISEIHKCLK
ncbi:MAG: hypothetical protein HQK79_15810 [Desulfobacterales bacterium]|nr:hypothetical protein [Desulfobacterales bacterium]